MKLPSKETDGASSDNEGGVNGNSNGNTHSIPPQAVNTVPDVVHDTMLSGAIDAMFRSHEQTYEQFLQSFSHLTVADIARSHARLVSEELAATASDLSPSSMLSTLAHGESQEFATAGHGEVNTPQEETRDHGSDDDLQEEVLDEGTVVADPLLRSSDISAAGSLKVDNFLVLEENEDSSEETETSYQASFADSLQRKDSETDDVPETEPTDVGAANEITSATRHHVQFESPGIKVQSNKEQHQNILNEEVNDVDEQSHCVRYDIVLNAKKWESFCKEIADSDDEDLTYDASLDGLNPGEVEKEVDTNNTEPVHHKTQLDFTECQSSTEAAGNDSTQNDAQSACETTESCCTDVVEPFQLDEDFDYDNVTLTPKYSAAEMALLADLLKQNITPTRVPFAASGPQDERSSGEDGAV